VRKIAPIVACLVFAAVTVAFAAAPEAPKPGPEHQKLGYFAGKWTAEGQMKESPFGPGGKVTSMDHCEWFQGKFAVVCHTDGKGPMGPMKGLGILGYNAEQKVYTYYGLDNSGMVMTSVPRGTVQGDTWTFTDESEMGGKKLSTRYTIKEQSPNSYTFKWDLLGDDGQWTTIMEGKQTKAMEAKETKAK